MNNSGIYVQNTLTSMLQDGGRPKLTWYGPDFERIELSGAVFNNWVNKTTNLLTEEFELEPEKSVSLNLPPHWRFLTWAIASLRTGATLVLGSAVDAGLVITNDPELYSEADELVVVSLGALARKFDGTLPPGAIDAAAAVMTYSDGLGYVAPTVSSENAIVSTDAQVVYADLGQWTVDSLESTGERTLLRCANDSTSAQSELIRHALGIWHSGGSIVLFGSGIESEISDDSARLERIVASEKITNTIVIE